MHCELCIGETPLNVKDKFRLKVFRCIIDQLINGFTEKFSDNIKLVTDMQYLLPDHFKDVKDLSDTALKKII